MKKRRRLSPDTVWLILALLMGMGLGRMQTVARGNQSVDPVTRMVRTVYLPAGSGLRPMIEGPALFFSGIGSAGSVAQQRQTIARLQAAMELYASEAAEWQRSYESLAKQQQGPNYGRIRVPAQILLYSPYRATITLSKGRNDGIEVGQGVVADGGLLAVVTQVDATRCQAALITSSSQAVGAALRSEPPAVGLVRGESSQRLIFEFTQPIEVKPGSVIVTSGFSEHIPPGVPIGFVTESSKDRDFGSLRAFLVPRAKVDRVREAWILK